MFSSKTKSLIAFGLFFALNTILFQNCGVQKPKVEILAAMKAGFGHSTTLTSCSTCHASRRPTVATTLSADGVSNLYMHTANYQGGNDCVLCHTQNQADIGVSWKNGLFNHKDNLGTTVATCAECHTGNKPSTLVGTTLFDHTTIGTQDCAACHKNVGANWSTTTFSHTPTPNSCVSCHSSGRPSPTIFYPSLAAQPTLNLYAHDAQFNGSADCVNCHTANVANAGVTWAGAFYGHETNMGSSVTTCISCHTGSRPATHTAQSGQMGDCFACHTNAGVSWTPSAGSVPSQVTMAAPVGSNLTAITIKHPSLQSGMACATCHTSYNATNSIKGFDHTEGLVFAASNAPVNNSCYYCHYSPNSVIDSVALTNNTTRTYKPGQIVVRPNSHQGETLNNSSSCLSCHTTTAPPSWNPATKAWTTGGAWNGG